MKTPHATEKKAEKTPGTAIAERLRDRANKFSDAERKSLLGEAMRIIYRPGEKAAHAHLR